MITKSGNDAINYAVAVQPNSFSGRYGGTGTDFKIYFDDENDIKKGIDAVMFGRAYLESKGVKIV